MESSYGVGVTNRFAIPDEEDVEVDDPLDIIQSVEKKATEQKKEVKKPVAKGKAPEKSQPKSSANDKPRGQNRGSDKPSQPRGERGERGGERRERKPREGGERRPRREGGNNQGNSGFSEESSFGQESSFGGETQSFGDRDTRERGRGRGRGRGGPRGAGAPREGRREFDRRSGSDRSHVRAQDKREGGGPRNWGNPVNDFGVPEDAPQTEATTEDAAPTTTEGVEGENKPAEEAAPVVEDEDAKLMTLDEYRTQQQQSRYKSDVNVRKPGENEDLSKWKNTRRYERPAQVNDEDDVEYVIEKKDQRSHSRQTVDLSFKFNVDNAPRGAPEGRRGRGGRGGGGGGRGGARGAPSGSRSYDAPQRRERGPGGSYNFRDDDFPALG
ncbi:intracellular hyaluronan-binding protein 4-like [Sycon ciliatum]|uniref:intracellular hyaluronan-binding protein 4-like n=1 Tax=Sycon ciliatum TaxID=27933 RepID=UPI0020A9A731|eukprot:scpid62854/ scgid12686/ 